MIRRPPRSTQSRSSAASDVYKRQALDGLKLPSNASKEWSGTKSELQRKKERLEAKVQELLKEHVQEDNQDDPPSGPGDGDRELPVSYTHLRAHETRHDLVCRLLL